MEKQPGIKNQEPRIKSQESRAKNQEPGTKNHDKKFAAMNYEPSTMNPKTLLHLFRLDTHLD